LKAEQIVEAVLFASDAPLRPDEIARADDTLDEDAVEAALARLRAFYLESERAFQLVEVAEGYQLLTEPRFSPYLDRLETVPRPSRLSGPALEALAIIAYRQPIGRMEVEYIRGVGSSGVIRTLQDRGLIDVVGRGEGLGRPLLYGTTNYFLQHFGFRSMEDLPRPDELPVILRDRSMPILPEEEGGGEEGGGEEGGGDGDTEDPKGTSGSDGTDDGSDDLDGTDGLEGADGLAGATAPQGTKESGP